LYFYKITILFFANQNRNMRVFLTIFAVFSLFVGNQFVTKNQNFHTTSKVITNEVFYITPSGERYHKGSCRHVDNVSKAVSIAQACGLGRTPCKMCKPIGCGSNYKSNSFFDPYAGSNTAHGTKSQSVRCSGTTLKGLRCKRKTRIGNGRCFQHQE